jgi:cobalt-precorrin-5B (C1)-methyltransferase
MALSGYTLPVFACASALAALKALRGEIKISEVTLDLIEPEQIVVIPIDQVSKISDNQALAITHSDPGDNLDLTRNTPIWSIVEFLPRDENLNKHREQVLIKGGEGVGMIDGKAAIYSYAKKLLITNLKNQLFAQETLQVTIILPEGRRLAQSTSNEAFGVVGGLSLLGTSGISRPLTSADQLELYLAELVQKKSSTLVFCIGENGYDLAVSMGIPSSCLIKTANWLGPMLAAAGEQQSKQIILLGYHGKLLKLAGGIFHTHHHIADARREILTAYSALSGLSKDRIKSIYNCETAEKVWQELIRFSAEDQEDWIFKVYNLIASAIEKKASDYIRKHSENKVLIGTILFNRKREIILKTPTAQAILKDLSLS